MSPADRRPAVSSPPRLADGRDPIAGALREVKRKALPAGSQEAVAWRRIEAQLGAASGPRFWRARWWAAGAALAALGLIVAGRVWRSPPRMGAAGVAGPVVVARVAPVAPAPASRARPPLPEAPRLALASVPRELPVGRSLLADEASVEIAPATSARASSDHAFVHVVVDWGEVRLHVEKRVEGGPGFEVAAGPYRFRVLGTRFRVARRPEQDRGGHVDLWVDEGRVAVTRGGRSLRVVEAGGHWSGTPATHRRAAVPAPPEPATQLAPAAAPVPAPGPSRARCAQLAAAMATASQAVSCYLAEAEGTGIAAETALYEVARLRRDQLADEAGALAAFRLYRARFPQGMLRAEVDLWIVELLPKLNRHHEALEEIGYLLAEPSGRERAAELRLLRGNIYREVLEDFGSAERDYAAVEAAQAPHVGDATFFRGVCLQALGRGSQARASLERYLASGSRRFADEARRRLARLAR